MSRVGEAERVFDDVYMPLPIALRPSRHGWNEHHAFFFSSDPLLQGDEQRVVRWSRLQYVPEDLHTFYHQEYDEVWLPRTPESRFKTVLLNSAGYLPNHAVDVSGKGVKKVLISRDEQIFFQANNIFRTQQRMGWRIGYYLAHEILKNGLDAVRDTQEVAQFLEARNQTERQMRTFGVIRAASSLVLESFEPIYEVARTNGSIRRPETTATRFVMRLFDHHQPDYADMISLQLQGA